jgi:hypothetical protein
MQPVTIASVRAHGVRQLLVYCLGNRFTCPARNADAEINEVGHAESSVFSADLGCFVARARAMRFTHGRQTLSQVRDAAFLDTQIGALQTAHLWRTDVTCGLGMLETRVQTTHVWSETT